MSTETQELSLVENEPNLALMKRADIPQIFAPFELQIAPLAKIANDLAITDASQLSEIAIARTTRLSLKKLRVAVETRRKELKEGILEEGRKIDGAANALKDLIEPLEQKLMEQEKIAERLEAERKAKLVEERTAALLKYEVPSAYMALGDMPQETFDQLLENSRAAFEAKKAEALRLEQEHIRLENERLIREKEEASERERVKAENARLRAEAEERDRKAAEERASAEKEAARLKKIADDAEAARKAQEARAAREKQEAEEKAAAKLRAEQEKNERARKESEERSKKERDAIEARASLEKAAAELKAREEREAREAEEKKKRIAENKLKAQREAEHAHQLAENDRKAQEQVRQERQARERAEAQVEAQRIREEQEKRDAEAAAMEAAKAPDREKLLRLSETLLALPMPDMTTESGSMTLERVEKEISAVAAYVVKKAQSM